MSLMDTVINLKQPKKSQTYSPRTLKTFARIRDAVLDKIRRPKSNGGLGKRLMRKPTIGGKEKKKYITDEEIKKALLLDGNNLEMEDLEALLLVRRGSKHADNILKDLVKELWLKHFAYVPSTQVVRRWTRYLQKIIEDNRAQTCVSPAEIFNDYPKRIQLLAAAQEGSESGPNLPVQGIALRNQPYNNGTAAADAPPLTCFVLGCNQTFSGCETRDQHISLVHLKTLWCCLGCGAMKQSEALISNPHCPPNLTQEFLQCAYHMYNTTPPVVQRELWKVYPMLLKRPVVEDPLYDEIDRFLSVWGV